MGRFEVAGVRTYLSRRKKQKQIKIRNMDALTIFHVIWGFISVVLIAFGIYCIFLSVRHEVRKIRDMKLSNNIRKNR